jgi:hypothetical protein
MLTVKSKTADHSLIRSPDRYSPSLQLSAYLVKFARKEPRATAVAVSRHYTSPSSIENTHVK